MGLSPNDAVLRPGGNKGVNRTNEKKKEKKTEKKTGTARERERKTEG